jgi:DNA-binding beta-propeller fold protein YncE
VRQFNFFHSAYGGSFLNHQWLIGAASPPPALTQVIQQTNAHVGLVFSPDGNTLYAAGGNDDAVYVYDKSGGTFITPGTQMPCGSMATATLRPLRSAMWVAHKSPLADLTILGLP